MAKECTLNKYTSVSPAPGRRQRVYLAAPIATYRTPRYDWAIAQVHAHFPEYQLLSPRELYTRADDCLAQWPATCSELSALVFITDGDDWIGFGVWREIHDAAFTGVRVWHLHQDGLLPFHEIGFDAFQPHNWRQYA